MLDDIKLLLGISDALQDSLLNLLIKDSEERILATISEGTTAYSEEGRSYSWEKNYLEEYLPLFDEYTKTKTAGKGIARWI